MSTSNYFHQLKAAVFGVCSLKKKTKQTFYESLKFYFCNEWSLHVHMHTGIYICFSRMYSIFIRILHSLQDLFLQHSTFCKNSEEHFLIGMCTIRQGALKVIVAKSYLDVQ